MTNESFQPSLFDLAYLDEADKQDELDASPQPAATSANDNRKSETSTKSDNAEKERKAGKTLEEQTRDLKAIELLATAVGLTHSQAEEVLAKAGGFHRLARLPDYVLINFPHIGEKRAAQICAMTEWALLLSKQDNVNRIQMRCPADIANLLLLEMSTLEREELRVVGLDSKHNVMFEDTIYKGSLNSAVIRVSEIFRRPVAQNCASIVVVHNHPSGDPTPSPEDVQVTNLIRETGKSLDIDVIDHLVIGGNRFVSLKERGLGFP